MAGAAVACRHPLRILGPALLVLGVWSRTAARSPTASTHCLPNPFSRLNRQLEGREWVNSPRPSNRLLILPGYFTPFQLK